MALDQRETKGSHVETILYEIDMLRHIASLHDEKRHAAEANGSRTAVCEYYLSIEGFLLHARNLLAFFTNHPGPPTDLIINRPEIWNEKAIDPSKYADLSTAMKELDSEFGADQKTCFDQISKFLLHCTEVRYEQLKNWDLDGMFKRMDPILKDFSARFTRWTTPVVTRPDTDRNGANTSNFTKILWPGEETR